MRTKNKQMANRDLLKEAIADAKAVKETAIANAKAALEEAFTPFLKERLAAKLSEMDEMEEEVDLKEADMEEGLDEADVEEGKTKSLDDFGSVKNVDDYTDDFPKKGKIAKNGPDDGGETEIDEVDLDELLRELDELEEDGFGKFSSDGTEGFSAEEEGETPMKALDEAEGEEEEKEEGAEGEEEEEEEIDIENMSEDDLKNFIESVIADMVASGELEGNMEASEEGEEGEEEVEGGEEMEMPVAEEKEMDEAKEMEMEAMKKELEEAYAALETVKAELNEVNLLNAKLLYTNKIFKAKNLTESQKVKVLEAFDKAASVKEAKLVYETLNGNFASTAKKPMNESLIKGGASKPAGISEKKPIIETNNQVARWQKLAGIK